MTPTDRQTSRARGGPRGIPRGRLAASTWPCAGRSPVTPAEVAATRRPVDQASLLPPRVFHDPDVLAFEQAAWFGRSWVCVGREEDVDRTGRYFLARGRRREPHRHPGRGRCVRAFHNVCRHRGSLICTEDRRPARPVPVSVSRLDLRARRPTASGEPHRRPRSTSTTREFGLGRRPGGRVAGLRVRVPRCRGARPGGIDGRPVAAHRPVPAGGPASGPAHRVRRRRQLEGHRRELLRVLSLPRRASPAQSADALRPGSEHRVRRAHGVAAGWSCGDDVDTMSVDGSAPRSAAAPRGHRGGRAAHLLLPGLAQPAAEPASRLPDDPPGLAGRAGSVTCRSASGSSIPTRWRSPTSTRPTRSTSGT